MGAVWKGQGSGWVGGELPSVGCLACWRSSFTNHFKEGQPNLSLTQAGLDVLFCPDVFLFHFLFLFKRIMTQTTWEVCPVFDHFTTPTTPSEAQ